MLIGWFALRPSFRHSSLSEPPHAIHFAHGCDCKDKRLMVMTERLTELRDYHLYYHFLQLQRLELEAGDP